MAMLVITLSSSAKINNTKKEIYKVNGNCDMCKITIEKAANQNKVAKAVWNLETKLLTLTYDSTKTNADEVLKRIANVGYDNEKYLAAEEVYNKLHGCCQYVRNGIPQTPILTASLATEMPSEKMDNMPVVAEVKEEVKETTAETTTIPKVEVPVAKADFKMLLTKYYTLKNALIADNSTLASNSATALLTEINAVKMESLSNADHIIWMKYYEKLKADVVKISSTKSIEKQRTAFSSLSNNLWSTVKGLKIKDNGAIYVDYCPMKNAYWLSKEAAIKNPYYGKSMLTCGSIKETIK